MMLIGVTACGGQSTVGRALRVDLNDAGQRVSGDLASITTTSSSTLRSDAATLNGLAGRAPEQLKKPLGDLAGFITGAGQFANGRPADSAGVAELTAAHTARA